MEVVLLLVCAGAAGFAVWLLLGQGSPENVRLSVRVRALGHVARRALGRCAELSLCQELAHEQHLTPVIDRVDERLRRHGLALGPAEVVVLLVAGLGLGCVAMGMLSRSLVVGVVTLPVLAALVPLYEARDKRNKAQEVAGQMPGVLRTLATALGAGHTLTQAVEYVSLHERGQAAQAFGRAALRLRCGMPAESALTSLADELDAPGAGLMACALAISQRTGSPLRELLQRSALLVEQQGEFQRMLAVKTAQVRLSVRVVCTLPVVMIVLLGLISPDYREGLHTVPGAACLALGALMDGAALLVIRTILKGVL